MIRIHHLMTLTAVATLLGAAGCTNRPAATRPAVTPLVVNGVPVGWKVYTPPEGDFRVAAPGEPTVVPAQREKEQTVRTYVFRKGDATLTVLLFERTGKAAEMDRPAQFRADPRVMPRTLHEVELDGVPGLDFLYDDPHDGACQVRLYRSKDGKQAVHLRITRPETLPAHESGSFLDSFKLTKK
jgi:hypothetical protein